MGGCLKKAHDMKMPQRHADRTKHLFQHAGMIGGHIGGHEKI